MLPHGGYTVLNRVRFLLGKIGHASSLESAAPLRHVPRGLPFAGWQVRQPVGVMRVDYVSKTLTTCAHAFYVGFPSQ